MVNSRLHSMRIADEDWERIGRDALDAGFVNPSGGGNVTGYLIQLAGLVGGWEPVTREKGKQFSADDLRDILQYLNGSHPRVSAEYFENNMNRFAFRWCRSKDYLLIGSDEEVYITNKGITWLNNNQ